VPAPAGLVAWWPADGNAQDATGANNGVLENGATATGMGIVGPGFSFNGSTQYVHVNGSAAISGPRSVEAWVFPNPNTGLGLPILTGGKSGAADLFAIDGTTLYVDHWGTARYNSDVPLVTNTWNHVAMTYDGTQVNLYVNGAKATPIKGKLYDYSMGTYDIGGNNVGGSTTKASFNGLIDELAIYNQVLDDSEIRAIYFAKSLGKCPLAAAGPKLSVTLNGQHLTISWTPTGGTLQETDDLTKPWSDFSMSNPSTVPVTGAQKFFRVKK
jgi:hypothetical protein